MTDFTIGFKYVLSGFKLIIQPGIRIYVLIPLLINTILFASVIAYGSHLFSDFIDSWSTGWWQWTKWILWPLFVMISLAVIFFCFSIVANLIAAPFNSFLAEAVESKLSNTLLTDAGGIKAIPGEIIKAMKSESRKFLYFTIRAIPLLLLFFIPIGQVAAPFLWVLFGSWMLALEYIDYPMGNHGIVFPEQRKIMTIKKKQTFGFGLGIMLLTFIPVINFVAMPVAVAGASKLWVEKLKPTQNTSV
ncbi:MAG: sulfate transporter CysZ [Proteobacteria bacterium]|nr:sulfate transporter CysZ [Pseudomonadota bacterium]